jgi:hypothetical protein
MILKLSGPADARSVLVTLGPGCRLHGADICCRRSEDEGRLREGSRELGGLNQDLFIGVLAIKGGALSTGRSCASIWAKA